MSKRRILISVAAAAMAFAVQSFAQAAPCEVVSGTAVTCAKNTACITVSKIDSLASTWELQLNNKVLSTQPVSQTQVNYPVPVGATLTTAAVWSAVAIGTDGQRSASFSCSQPFDVKGPNAAPQSPGLRVISGATS